MKKLVVVMIAVFAFSFANAQELSFGAKVGGSYAGTLTSDSDYNDFFDAVIAPHFGVVVELGLSDVFSIQPEVLYSPSGFHRGDTFETVVGDIEYDVTGKVNYLTVPVMARYFVTDALSIDLGPYVGFLLSANVDGVVEAPAALGGTTTFDKEDMKEDYNSTDIGFGFGASYGLESGLFFQARYTLGLTDINAEDLSDIPVGDGVLDKDDTIKNNIFQLAVGYKFM